MTSPIIFFVDGKVIDPQVVLFHFQPIPRPGGHIYEVVVSLSRHDVIATLEEMHEVKISNKIDFLRKVGTTHSSGFNAITWIKGFCNDKKIDNVIKWVFNTIDNAEIKENNLIIYGQCSEAVDDFM